MFLDKNDEESLQGEHGPILQWAFSVLIAEGERNAAESLVPVKSVHIPGDLSLKSTLDLESCNGKNIFFPGLAVSTNPLCAQELFPGVSLFNLRHCGCRDIHTCTPYLCGNAPSRDSICAWGGRSAVTMLNSIIGARSNPQSFHGALASAISGKTPFYGMLTDEGREPQICIEIERDLKVDPAIFGYHLARELHGRIPFIRGWRFGFDESKRFSGCFNITGRQPLFILKESAQTKDLETLSINDLNFSEWNDNQKFQPDMIILGCPHLSEQQINRLAKLLPDRPENDIEFNFFTSRLCLDKCPKSGAVLSRRGKIFIDCCPSSVAQELRGKSILTDNPALKECLSQKGCDVNIAPWEILEEFLGRGHSNGAFRLNRHSEVKL